MAATASVRPRRCQLMLKAVCLKQTSIMQGRRSKGDGWEISNLISTVCLTSAAQGLLVTEALFLSLFLSQVLIHGFDCMKETEAQSPGLEGLCMGVLLIHVSTHWHLPLSEVYCSKQALAGWRAGTWVKLLLWPWCKLEKKYILELMKLYVCKCSAMGAESDVALI